MKNFLVVSIFLLVTTNTFAQVDTSIQVGFEYDSNVYKTFNQPTDDGLVRALFKSQGKKTVSEKFDYGWNFQLGGKKYFQQSAKDVFIQYLEAPLNFNFSNTSRLTSIAEFKYQNEDNSPGALPPSLPNDTNEDFYTPTEHLLWTFLVSPSVMVEPFAYYSFFDFLPTQTFSYHYERGGLSATKKIGELFTVGGSYAYSLQQFLAGDRHDREHEVSTWFQYSGLPFASLRYAYQNSTSSDQRFSFNNHRISLICSFPFGRKVQSGGESPSDDVSSLFVIHLLGTVQFKNYPSVFGSTSDGIRYLLTGGEDENFNTIVIKLTYHPTSHFAIETKLNRYSNEFSDQPLNFARYLAYLGARYLF